MTEHCSSLGACCKRGRQLYTTTEPSCCIPALYCNLSATLQTMSIIVVNLQDNRAVFQFFIALLRFSLTLPRTSHNKNVLFTVRLYLHQKRLVTSDTFLNIQHGFFFKLLAGVVSNNHMVHFLPL